MSPAGDEPRGRHRRQYKLQMVLEEIVFDEGMLSHGPWCEAPPGLSRYLTPTESPWDGRIGATAHGGTGADESERQVVCWRRMAWTSTERMAASNPE